MKEINNKVTKNVTKRKRKTKNTHTSPLPLRVRSERIAKLKLKSPPLSCGICLELVKTRGFIESCNHIYCFSCITKWTKRSSTCPQCKREIRTILKTDINGKTISRVYNVKKRVLRDTIDREEFQERRTQIMRRERNISPNTTTTTTTRPIQLHEFRHNVGHEFQNINLNYTQQLLDVHQIIRDNMTRLGSTGGSYSQHTTTATFPQHFIPQQPPTISIPPPPPCIGFNLGPTSYPIGNPMSNRSSNNPSISTPTVGLPNYVDHLVQMTTAVSQVPIPSLLPFITPSTNPGIPQFLPPQPPVQIQQMLNRNQDLIELDAASVLYNIQNSYTYPNNQWPRYEN